MRRYAHCQSCPVRRRECRIDQPTPSLHPQQAQRLCHFPLPGWRSTAPPDFRHREGESARKAAECGAFSGGLSRALPIPMPVIQYPADIASDTILRDGTTVHVRAGPRRRRGGGAGAVWSALGTQSLLPIYDGAPHRSGGGEEDRQRGLRHANGGCRGTRQRVVRHRRLLPRSRAPGTRGSRVRRGRCHAGPRARHAPARTAGRCGARPWRARVRCLRARRKSRDDGGVPAVRLRADPGTREGDLPCCARPAADGGVRRGGQPPLAARSRRVAAAVLRATIHCGHRRKCRARPHRIRDLSQPAERGFTGTLVPVHPRARHRRARGLPIGARHSGDVDLAVVVVPRGDGRRGRRRLPRQGRQGPGRHQRGLRRDRRRKGRRSQAELVEKIRAAGMRHDRPELHGHRSTPIPRSARTPRSRRCSAAGPRRVLDPERRARAGHPRLRAAARTSASRRFVSVGNKADVSGNDLLQYWEPTIRGTDVILLYLESFGNPRKFARDRAARRPHASRSWR